MQRSEPIINVMSVDTAINTSTFYSLAAYGTLAFGYVLSIAFTPQLTLLQFSLATLVNGIWVAAFIMLCQASQGNQGAIRLAILFIVGVAIQSLALVGVHYNWLIVAVTIGVITTAVTPLVAAYSAGGMLLCSTIIVSILNHGNIAGTATDIIQIASVVVFVYAFSVIARKYEIEHQHSNELIESLGNAQQQLHAYADQIEDLAISRERNRMAREIHDTLGHYLTILALKLETATKLEERGDASLHAELVDARRFAGECLAEVRQSVAALRPTDTTAPSFTTAIQRLVTEFKASCPATAVIVDSECTIPESTLDADLRLTLFRAVQESLTNIRKHARASKVLLRLRIDAAQAELTIIDNGIGQAAQATDHTVGYGLLGLQERVALLNGTSSSAAQPDTGWRVQVTLPHGVSASMHA